MSSCEPSSPFVEVYASMLLGGIGSEGAQTHRVACTGT